MMDDVVVDAVLTVVNCGAVKASMILMDTSSVANTNKRCLMFIMVFVFDKDVSVEKIQ